MVQLGIHRPKILQEQFNGIDLALLEQGGGRLGGRRSHDGREWELVFKANRLNFLPLAGTKQTQETQSWLPFFGGARGSPPPRRWLSRAPFIRSSRCKRPFITKSCWSAQPAALGAKRG